VHLARLDAAAGLPSPHALDWPQLLGAQRL
jgi:hypothetical protein